MTSTCCYCLPLPRAGALACLACSLAYCLAHLLSCLLPPSPGLPPLPTPLPLLLLSLRCTVLLACLPLLPGILLARPLLLLPWLLTASTTAAAEAAADVFLASRRGVTADPVTAFVFTGALVLLALQTYTILTMASLYVEMVRPPCLPALPSPPRGPGPQPPRSLLPRIGEESLLPRIVEESLLPRIVEESLLPRIVEEGEEGVSDGTQAGHRSVVNL